MSRRKKSAALEQSGESVNLPVEKSARLVGRGYPFLIGFVALLIGFAISQLGMVQFGGFDHSVLVDVAWRLVQGQKPHVDFPCTLPVGFIIGAKYAFQIFGVSWRALILFTALFSVLTFIWSVWLLRRLFGNARLALLWAATLQSLTLVLVSYWWYNPITSVAAVIFLLCAVLFWRDPDALAARVSYFFALFLIVLMKPNIAGILVPWVSVVLFLSPRHRLPVLALSVGAFAAFLVFLWVNHVGLSNLIKGYLTVAERGGSLKQFLQDLEPVEKGLSCLAFALAILPGAAACFRSRSMFHTARWPWLALGAILAGTYGFLTNGELKLVDLPPVLFGSLLLAALPGVRPAGEGRARSQQPTANSQQPISTTKAPSSLPAAFALTTYWNRYAAGLCLLLTIAGVAQAFNRQRVKAIGPYMFFEERLAPQAFADGFFKGLRSGEIFVAVNQQLAELLRKEPGASVAFGPRMQWAYAAFNKPSPRNQPIWWHPGVSFAAVDEELYISRFLDSRFDLIVIFKGNGPTVYMSDNFVRELLQRYSVDQSYSTLIVLRRNKG